MKDKMTKNKGKLEVMNKIKEDNLNLPSSITSKKKVLFISGDLLDFFGIDYNILVKSFDVKSLLHREMNILNFLLNIFKGVLWADVTFSWFADYHAFWAVRLSKIFRKKSIVVVGGYDVVVVPEIGYGALLNKKVARRVRYILENADRILPFSKNSEKEVLKYLTQKEKVKVIYLGVDYHKFVSAGEKENLVITVGYVTHSNLKRKGLETFVKSAKYLPDIEFVLIGPHIDDSIHYLKSIATPNVKFVGFVSDDELIKYYQRAKVYVQVSAHEGFGVAMAEAMSCECVPVVTDKGAIPEVVGDAGFYVPYGDPKATAEAIKEALKSDKGKEARERIKNMFPIEKREDELLKVILEVCSNER